MKFEVTIRRRSFSIQKGTFCVDAKNAHDAAEIALELLEQNEDDLEDFFFDVTKPIYDDNEVIKVDEIDESDEVITTE